MYSNFTDTPIAPPKPIDSFAQSRTEPWDLGSLTNASFHGSYRTLDEIYSFMHDLAAARPDLVRLVGIGHSAQGREMYALEISSDPSPPPEGPDAVTSEGAHERRRNKHSAEGKIGFALTGAQHAREVRCCFTSPLLVL